jgi:DNA repair protein RadA/Sms
METKKCRACGKPLDVGMARCANPKCLTWNVRTSAVESDSDDSTVLLSDTALTKVERIETELVDEVFGGGIVKTSTCLLGGEPGAGKTTLCLQLADVLAQRTAKEILYIANEQSPSELQETASRLQIRNMNRIRIVKAMGGVASDIGDLIMRYKPGAIFLDSVTNWVGEDLELAVTVCKNLKSYSVEMNAPSIIINQITKGGDHAGLMKMQHAVDMTVIFQTVELEEKDAELLGQDIRSFQSLKNRHGRAPEEQLFEMTEKGLVAVEGDEDD